LIGIFGGIEVPLIFSYFVETATIKYRALFNATGNLFYCLGEIYATFIC